MSDLDLDFDELRTSANRAANAKRTFDGVQLTSDIIAGAVGHDGLASQVRDFNEKWSIARGKLSEQLQFISDSPQRIRVPAVGPVAVAPGPGGSTLRQRAPMARRRISAAGPGRLSARLTMRTWRRGWVRAGLAMGGYY